MRRLRLDITDELGTSSRSLIKLIRRSVLATLRYEGVKEPCRMSVTFTDNGGIRELNRQYRQIDRETDVLSFPLTDYEGGEEPTVYGKERLLGDMVLSLERAEEQAREYGHSFEREAAFLTVHSTLHLLGYDHVNSEEEDRQMRRRQREILEQMGLSVQ